MRKAAYIETYGCWLSKGEGEIIKKTLESRGCKIVQKPEQASLIIIHTCAVRGDTERKMLKIISSMHEKALNTGAILVVSGCLVNVRPKSILRVAPRAILVEPDALEKIAEAAESGMSVIRKYLTSMRKTLPPVRGMHTYILPIETGCMGNCYFCVGKLARIRLFSYPQREIVEKIREAVEKGVKQIFLVGQDVAAYGRDRGTNLIELLNEILSSVEGNYRIRLGMMEPMLVYEMLDGLIEAMKDERIYNYLHLPAQSFDDKVLKLMNRQYTVNQYLEIVEEFRRKIPLLNIATDIIVGYPGEDEKSFEKTLSYVKSLKFDKVHVARYTQRPFTKAYILNGQVPEPEKKRRSKILSEAAAKAAHERNMLYLGKIFNALIEKASNREANARLLQNYKPVVIKEEKLKAGQIVKVKIERAEPYYLIGRLF